MKVIEFINEIYIDGIEDKTKVRFVNEPSSTIWEYNKSFNTLTCGIENKDLLMCLNDEIELIEEEKPIEKIMQLDTRETQDCIIAIQDKINEIIDYLKYKEEEKEK
jgi:hypothetical protein